MSITVWPIKHASPSSTVASPSTRKTFTLDTGKTEMCITLVTTQLFKLESRLNDCLSRLETPPQCSPYQRQEPQEVWVSNECAVSVNLPVINRGDERVLRHLDEGVGRHPRAFTPQWTYVPPKSSIYLKISLPNIGLSIGRLCHLWVIRKNANTLFKSTIPMNWMNVAQIRWSVMIVHAYHRPCYVSRILLVNPVFAGAPYKEPMLNFQNIVQTSAYMEHANVRLLCFNAHRIIFPCGRSVMDSLVVKTLPESFVSRLKQRIWTMLHILSPGTCWGHWSLWSLVTKYAWGAGVYLAFA